MSVPRIVYGSVDPQNVKATYQQGDNIDFLMAFPGRSLELGSVRLEGVFKTFIGGNECPTQAAPDIDVVFIDHFVGAHSVLSSIQTSMGGSQLETISDYPRWIKMHTTATKSQTDMLNSENVCELKSPNTAAARVMLMGEAPQALTGAAQNSAPNHVAPDFSFKPAFVLNSASGLLPYRKSGDVRVMITLEQIVNVLFGKDTTLAGTRYELSELRLTYRTVPDAGPQFDQPVALRRLVSVSETFDTTQANLNMRVPAVCSAFHCSFMRTSQIGDAADNYLSLERIPGLSAVQYTYNDSTNALVSYQLENQVEWLGRYLDSFGDHRYGTNAASLSNIYGNACFGLGLDLGGPVDLSRQKLSIQITSGVTESYTCWMYFVSYMTI